MSLQTETRPIAIDVQDLSKLYVLGGQSAGYSNFREAFMDAAAAPFRRLAGIARSGSERAGEQFWALSDVSFQVPRGQIVGVVGRNGAGKSTLLKILSRITEPTTGQIRIHGRVASLLEVGTGFHPELTGRENIFLNGAILGMRRTEIRARFDEIVEFAEIERFLDTPVKRYSSGMYVRLAFAVAAHLEPEILIVDEVLAVGDAAFQKKCLGKMREVTGGGRTVLFVSHNLAAVSSLCHRVILLEQGRIGFDGGTAEGVSRYVMTALPGSDVVWDLDAMRRERADLRESASLLRVEAHPQAEGMFRAREPLRFSMVFETHRDLEGLTIAFNIDDLHGTRLVTVVKDCEELGMPVVSAGSTLRADIDIVNPCLLPGTYLLSTSVYSVNHWFDFVRHFGAIEISSLVHGRDAYLTLPPGAGVMELDAEWRLTSVGAGERQLTEAAP